MVSRSSLIVDCTHPNSDAARKLPLRMMYRQAIIVCLILLSSFNKMK